jgi:hypothetical protein
MCMPWNRVSSGDTAFIERSARLALVFSLASQFFTLSLRQLGWIWMITGDFDGPLDTP